VFSSVAVKLHFLLGRCVAKSNKPPYHQLVETAAGFRLQDFAMCVIGYSMVPLVSANSVCIITNQANA
jgi:hypothetical protein